MWNFLRGGGLCSFQGLRLFSIPESRVYNNLYRVFYDHFFTISYHKLQLHITSFISRVVKGSNNRRTRLYNQNIKSGRQLEYLIFCLLVETPKPNFWYGVALCHAMGYYWRLLSFFSCCCGAHTGIALLIYITKSNGLLSIPMHFLNIQVASRVDAVGSLQKILTMPNLERAY